MKKMFCFLMIALMAGTVVIAQEKKSKMEMKAAQIAREQTDKDVKQYDLTPTQKEKIYKVNLELARQKAALRDQVVDNHFQQEQEQTHFQKLTPILKQAQMSKLVKDHQKAMEAFGQN